ncbi:MAG: carbonic anhydrase family protein [Planctomycetota bacterium]
MITQTRETQAAITPDRALEMLREGNERFLARAPEKRDLLRQVELTKGGQAPFAVVLSCIDSRVPAETVFDQGIGDIFSARIAGNFVNHDLLGSIEFATKLAGAKLVLVLGHSRCGAVMGACDGAELGHLTGMLAHITPAVNAVADPRDPGERTSANAAFVQAVVEKNVEHAVAAMRERSSILRDLESSGAIRIAGAVYDVHSGRVDFGT